MPGTRLVMLAAWAKREGNTVDYHSEAYPIVGMVAAMHGGLLRQFPLIVFGCGVVNVREWIFLRQRQGFACLYEIVDCTRWDRSLDEERLGERLDRMADRAAETADKLGRVA
jgi:hypothetical protein